MKNMNIGRMGKRIMMCLGVAALVLVTSEGTLADSLKEREAKKIEQRLILNQVANNGTKIITSEEAKSIALKAAGINPQEVQYVKVKLDQENDYRVQYIYEVEFLHNGFEYEFDIDAETKQILKSKVDSWAD